MNFHTPTLSDKEWVEEAFIKGQTDCCEYCFGNIYMWAMSPQYCIRHGKNLCRLEFII